MPPGWCAQLPRDCRPGPSASGGGLAGAEHRSARAMNATEADWDSYSFGFGPADGSRDMETDKSVLLEAGFDELHGVSWTKGCLYGPGTDRQDQIPRSGEAPPCAGADRWSRVPVAGAPLLLDGREVGTMRSARGSIGMALVRLGALHNVLVSGATAVTPMVPGWMRAGGDTAES